MYTIIGNGRLAKHLIFYFSALNIQFQLWHRGSLDELANCVEKSTHILVLIADCAIENFILAHHALLKNHSIIHCSGALLSEHAFTAHPLMTFTQELYPLADYQAIPFVLEQEGPSFSELFPQLPNPHYSIPKNAKPYYHALCVMANNFTTLLWQKFFAETSKKFQLPAEFAFPLLKQTANNLITHHQAALTGPFARQDLKTVEKNLQSLKDDNFEKIYQAFVDTFLTSKETAL